MWFQLPAAPPLGPVAKRRSLEAGTGNRPLPTMAAAGYLRHAPRVTWPPGLMHNCGGPITRGLMLLIEEYSRSAFARATSSLS